MNALHQTALVVRNLSRRLDTANDKCQRTSKARALLKARTGDLTINHTPMAVAILKIEASDPKMGHHHAILTAKGHHSCTCPDAGVGQMGTKRSHLCKHQRVLAARVIMLVAKDKATRASNAQAVKEGMPLGESPCLPSTFFAT